MEAGREHDDRFDAHGLLRPERASEVTRGWVSRYLVFAQRSDARFDAQALEQQAARFFRTKVGLMTPKRYGDALPEVDFAEIAVAPPGTAAEVRAVLARPARDDEYTLADALEHERRVTGLSALARRCPYVLEIERKGDADVVALVLAAVVASTLLGPIVDVGARDMFGVKTARLRLDGLV